MQPTVIDEDLEQEKSRIWLKLLDSEVGSDEEAKLKEEYVSVCRKIAWAKRNTEYK